MRFARISTDHDDELSAAQHQCWDEYGAIAHMLDSRFSKNIERLFMDIQKYNDQNHDAPISQADIPEILEGLAALIRHGFVEACFTEVPTEME